MTTDKAKKVLDLAREFTKAAMKKQDNLSFENRFMEAADQNGFDPMDVIGDAIEFAQLKQKLGDAAGDNPQYRKLAFGIAESVAGIYEKFCTDDELRTMLPKGAGDHELREGLAAEGAPTLSKLCARLG